MAIIFVLGVRIKVKKGATAPNVIAVLVTCIIIHM